MVVCIFCGVIFVSVDESKRLRSQLFYDFVIFARQVQFMKLLNTMVIHQNKNGGSF